MVGDHGNGLEVLPPEPKTWSIEDVCDWLSWKRLGQYTEVFRTERVDGAALLCLDRECAKELIPTIGPRLILLKELNALQESTVNGASDLLEETNGFSNGHAVTNGFHPASTVLEDERAMSSFHQDHKVVPLQQARIGDLENEVRTLNQTLQKFVQALGDPSARRMSAGDVVEPHLSPVNLQSRYEVETERVVENGDTAEVLLRDESSVSPRGGRSHGALDEGEGAEGLRHHGSPCEVACADSQRECFLRQPNAGELQMEIVEQSFCEDDLEPKSRAHSGGHPSGEGTSYAKEATHGASEVGGDCRTDPTVQSVTEKGDEADIGEAEKVSRRMSDLTIEVEADAEDTVVPSSSSSRAGSSGSQEERPSATRTRGGLLHSPGPPGPSASPSPRSPERTPGSRRGGIPRSRSNVSLRQNRGQRENRRHSLEGGGLLGRHPPEHTWQGAGGRPGPPSPDQNWQCIPPPPQNGFASPGGGHFPEPYPVYGSAPEVMYMPVLMPGYPASPGWEPPFLGSPGPMHMHPAPYLDRTASEGALLSGAGHGFGSPEANHPLTRRASLGSRSRALRSPGPERTPRGQESPREHQSRSVSIPSSPVTREVSPNSRGLLGSSPQSRSDAASRPPSAVSNGRLSSGRPPFYTHPRSSRSMQDLESAWVENQQAHPYQLSPGNGRHHGGWSVGEEGDASEGAFSPPNDMQSQPSPSGTGYFMPTYQVARKPKHKKSSPSPKPA